MFEEADIKLQWQNIFSIVLPSIPMCSPSKKYIYIYFYRTTILPCAALKFKKINWQLQNLRKLFSWWSHDICIAKHLKPWSEQFACLVCQCAPPSELSFTSFYQLALYLKVLMLECFHFSHTSGSLVLWWVYDTTVEVLLKYFVPARVVVCKHLFCNV